MKWNDTSSSSTEQLKTSPLGSAFGHTLATCFFSFFLFLFCSFVLLLFRCLSWVVMYHTTREVLFYQNHERNDSTVLVSWLLLYPFMNTPITNDCYHIFMRRDAATCSGVIGVYTIQYKIAGERHSTGFVEKCVSVCPPFVWSLPDLA